MTALIRGMDHIVELAYELEKMGIDEIIHWSNSSKPLSVDIRAEHSEVIIFYPADMEDSALENIKHKVKRLGLPTTCWRSHYNNKKGR